MKTELGLVFGRIGNSVAEELRASAAGAVDQFLTFGFKRAQMRIGATSEALTQALSSAVFRAAEVTGQVNLTEELEIKTSAELILQDIRVNTKEAVSQLKAINRSTSETVVELTRLRTAGGGRGPAPPVPNQGVGE